MLNDSTSGREQFDFDDEVVDRADRIIIVGYPKAGKTTYSAKFGKVIHTDDYMDWGYDQAVYVLLRMVKDRPKYVVEGVQGFRLFRKMLQTGDSLPDVVVYLKPRYPALIEHITMRKSLDTVWKECMALNNTTFHVPIVYRMGV